jgi:SAM-dependent methyltransferase
VALGDRNRLRATFDEDAELYDRARPAYPDALFDDLVQLGGIRPPAQLLEVGCGTGQATRSLARRGYEITCIELGESLAEVARQRLARYRQVRVITGSFEACDPGDSSFDLVLAATSWHWLDRERRYVRAAAILRPGGALAIITTHHVLPADGDPFFREIQEAYNAVDAGAEADAAPGTPPPLPDQVGDEREDIEASALFGDVKVRRYLWEQSYTEDQYLSLLSTPIRGIVQ